MTAAWPDTTGDTRPRTDSAWEEARWLVGRYRRMQVLCERVGAIDDDEDGRWPHVDKLADIIRASDTYGRAWDRYKRSHREPALRSGESDEAYTARWDAYDVHGPKPADFAADANDYATPHGIHAFRLMSSGEKKLLRILATVSTHRVEFSTGDADGLDDEGQAFVRDWAGLLPSNLLG